MHNKIKEVMTIQGKKTSWMIEKLKVKPSRFYGWLSNKHQPDILHLRKAASLLGVTIDELIDE